nr:MAG TPA: hypothetical protein [Caudoviricetes sp.]
MDLAGTNTALCSEHPGLSWLWDEVCHVRVLAVQYQNLLVFHLLVTDDMVPEFG